MPNFSNDHTIKVHARKNELTGVNMSGGSYGTVVSINYGGDFTAQLHFADNADLLNLIELLVTCAIRFDTNEDYPSSYGIQGDKLTVTITQLKDALKEMNAEPE